MKSLFKIPRMSALHGIRGRVTIALWIVIACLFMTADAKSQVPDNSQSTQQLVQKIYTSQIGVREKLSNSGPQVEKYLRYVGLKKGNPWCAAFVCWVLGEAGVSNPRSGWSPALFGHDKIIWGRGERGKVKGETVYNTRSAWSPDLFRDRYIIWDREQGTRSKPAWPVGREPRLVGVRPSGFPNNHGDGIKSANRSASPPRLITDYRLLITQSTSTRTPLENPQTPATGDIFGLFFPEKGRIAHTGFIDQWDGTWMTSVEGNTNVAGSREGDGVYRKRRLVRTVYKVARYINH